MTRTRIVLFALLAMVATQLSAAVLLVEVKSRGRAVPRVIVTLTSSTSSPVVATTDDEGIARFDVPPGTYDLEAGRSGFFAALTTVTVGTEETRFKVELEQRMRASASRPRPDPVRPAQPPPPPPLPPPPSRVDVEDGKNYAVVNLYYATDRAFTGETQPARLYGPHRGKLSLGIARVSIPRVHRLGELESPSIFKLEFRPDPEKHVVLLTVQPQRRDHFYAKLRNSIKASTRRETFVFIHGYNVTFEDAARRTAQIKYDLAFDGPAVLYSWPSWGKTKEYPADGRNADWAAGNLRHFLTDLAAQAGASSIHLVAHSMGNRVLAGALRELAVTATGPRFDQIVLAAPDLDADVFKRDLAPAFVKLGKHVTLYASSRDGALAAGKTFDRAPRLGDAGPGIVVLPNIDTIDVSDVDTSFLGHSYVADNGTVLSDVFCLIRGATAAATRCRLSPVGQHWKFAAAAEAVANLGEYRCTADTCRR